VASDAKREAEAHFAQEVRAVSWANAVQLAKAAIAKHTGVGVEKDRADVGVPLGARVGTVLTMKVTPFLRAQDSLVVGPEQFNQVVSISRLRVPMQGTVHRLYTSRGDDGVEKERFLQVYCDAVGDVQELVYFTRLLRLIPVTAEDQAQFTGEGGSGLGQTTFSVWREQLNGQGIPEAVLARAFGQADSIDYVRCAGSEDQDFVSPYSGEENRIDDRQGNRGLHQEVVFMPYRRLLGSGAEEQLLIETEIVTDQDGDQGKRDIHVDFMVGLVLPKEGVMAQ